MDYTELLTKTQAEITDRYKPKKERSLYLADIYASLKEEVRAERVRSCGSFLEFQISNIRSKLVHANFCKDRLCPMCTFRRSMKTFHQVSECVDFLAPRGYQYLFLTLTLKNCSSKDLVKTIDLLNSAKSKLLHRAKIKRFLQGAFCTLEITYNDKSGEWHPHLHCLLAVSSDYGKKVYLKHSEWRELWKECGNFDYLPILNVKAVNSANSEVFERFDGLSAISQISAVKEVTKYTVKDKQYLSGYKKLENGKYDPLLFARDRSLVSTLIPALYKRRLVSFSGCFTEARKHLQFDDPIDGNLVNDNEFVSFDEMPVARVFYNWKCGVYIRKVVPVLVTPFDDELPLAVNTGFVTG